MKPRNRGEDRRALLLPVTIAMAHARLLLFLPSLVFFRRSALLDVGWAGEWLASGEDSSDCSPNLQE